MRSLYARLIQRLRGRRIIMVACCLAGLGCGPSRADESGLPQAMKLKEEAISLISQGRSAYSVASSALSAAEAAMAPGDARLASFLDTVARSIGTANVDNSRRAADFYSRETEILRANVPASPEAIAAELSEANALLRSGQAITAASLANEAIADAEKLGASNRQLVSDGLEIVGAAKQAQSDFAGSEAALGQALTIAETMNGRNLPILLVRTKAHTYEDKQKNLSRARDLIMTSTRVEWFSAESLFLVFQVGSDPGGLSLAETHLRDLVNNPTVTDLVDLRPTAAMLIGVSVSSEPSRLSTLVPTALRLLDRAFPDDRERAGAASALLPGLVSDVVAPLDLEKAQLVCSATERVSDALLQDLEQMSRTPDSVREWQDAEAIAFSVSASLKGFELCRAPTIGAAMSALIERADTLTNTFDQLGRPQGVVDPKVLTELRNLVADAAVLHALKPQSPERVAGERAWQTQFQKVESQLAANSDVPSLLDQLMRSSASGQPPEQTGITALVCARLARATQASDDLVASCAARSVESLASDAALDPDRLLARRLLIEALLREGHDDLAERQIQKLSSDLHAEPATLAAELEFAGGRALSTQRWKVAIIAFQQALDARREGGLDHEQESLAGLGRAYLHDGQTAQGVNTYWQLDAAYSKAPELPVREMIGALVYWSRFVEGNDAEHLTSRALALAEGRQDGDLIAATLISCAGRMEALGKSTVAETWLQRAVDWYLKVLQTPTGYAPPRRTLALASFYGRTGRTTEQVREVQRIVSVLDQLPAERQSGVGLDEYHLQLVLALAADQRPTEAASAAQRTVELLRLDGSRHVGFGDIDRLLAFSAPAAALVFLDADIVAVADGDKYWREMTVAAAKLDLGDGPGAFQAGQAADQMARGRSAIDRGRAKIAEGLAQRRMSALPAAFETLTQAGAILASTQSSELKAVLAVNLIELAQELHRDVDVQQRLLDGGIDMIPQGPVRFAGLTERTAFLGASDRQQIDLQRRLAWILLENGSPPAAAFYFKQALNSPTKILTSEQRTEVWIGLAESYRRSGDTGDALPLFAMGYAQAAVTFGPSSPWTLRALYGLGFCERRRDRPDDGKELASAAIFAAKAMPALGDLSLKMQIDWSAADLGPVASDLAGSEDGAKLNAKIAELRDLVGQAKMTFGSDSEAELTGLVAIGHGLRRIGHYDEALATYDQAGRIVEQRFSIWHPAKVDIIAGSMLAAIASDQLDRARQYMSTLSMETASRPYRTDRRIEIEAFAASTTSLPPLEAKNAAWYGADLVWRSNAQPSMLARRRLAEYLITNAGGASGDSAAQTIEYGQLTQGLATGDAIMRARVRVAAHDPAGAALARDFQDAVEQIDVIVNQVVDAAQARQPVGSSAAGTIERDIQREATDGAELDRQYPSYAELVGRAPVKLADIQSLLRTDEAVLHIFVGDRATYLWAIRRDRVMFRTVPVGITHIDSLVHTIRGPIDSLLYRRGDTTSSSFPSDAAHALFEALIEPVASALDGVKLLYIVPDETLQQIPFSLFVTEPHLDSKAPLAWLIQRYALATLPSLSTLRALRQTMGQGESAAAAVQANQEPFIGFGAPALRGKPTDPIRMSDSNDTPTAQRVLRLPALPQAEPELLAMAASLHASADRVLVGPAATRAAVFGSQLSRFKTVAFSTHALVGGELGTAEPALVLTPDPRSPGDNGLLTAADILRLQLNADLVILSACNTAAPDTNSDENLSGLARSFFFAGARSLLVSHWPVAPEASAALTDRMVAAMASDPAIGHAEALREAMMAMISQPSLSQPFYWAPFVIVGEGR